MNTCTRCARAYEYTQFISNTGHQYRICFRCRQGKRAAEEQPVREPSVTDGISDLTD